MLKDCVEKKRKKVPKNWKCVHGHVCMHSSTIARAHIDMSSCVKIEENVSGKQYIGGEQHIGGHVAAGDNNNNETSDNNETTTRQAWIFKYHQPPNLRSRPEEERRRSLPSAPGMPAPLRSVAGSLHWKPVFSQCGPYRDTLVRLSVGR